MHKLQTVSKFARTFANCKAKIAIKEQKAIIGPSLFNNRTIRNRKNPAV